MNYFFSSLMVARNFADEAGAGEPDSKMASGKIVGKDGVRRTEHQRAFDGILQFTNIARPIVVHQARQGFR